MRGDAHVRFGGRAEETDRGKPRHRASVRPLHTYVRTWQGFLYVSFVLDLFSRRVVGWSMRNDLKSELVVDALNMAIEKRKPVPGLVHPFGPRVPIYEPRVRQAAARVGHRVLHGIGW